MTVAEVAGRVELKIIRVHNRRWRGNAVLHPQPKRPGLALAGYLSYMDPSRLQIFGKTEMGYLHHLPIAQRTRCLRRYLERKFPGIIVSTAMAVDTELAQLADHYQTPVLVSELQTSLLIARLSAILYRAFSKKIKINGVLLDIMGQGVMITGPSGIGKSETAIELINKGYHLVSDDVVEFYLNATDEPVGCASPLIKNLIEVRGLGIINVSDIFGAFAAMEEKKLDLVINLEKWDPKKHYDRLGEENRTATILGKAVPLINIPVAPGRNISTIIEVAVRYFLARKSGRRSYLESLQKTKP